MAFRDDHDAALARAAALERELAEAKARLAHKDRELDAVREDLAEAREDLDQAAEREQPTAEARARLEALVDDAERHRDRRAARDARREVRDRERAARRSSRGERIRLWRSMMWAGSALLDPVVLVYAVPLTALLGKPLYNLTGTVWSLLTVALSLALGPFCYAVAKLAWMRRWARSLPYELRGYPELLIVKPRSYDRGRSSLSPDGHEALSLILQFRGQPPADLARILRAFDGELTGSGTAWSRPSPVTEQRTKHGTRMSNADTNYEVHRWVRRLHRKVLRDLHQVSPLASVTVQLA